MGTWIQAIPSSPLPLFTSSFPLCALCVLCVSTPDDSKALGRGADFYAVHAFVGLDVRLAGPEGAPRLHRLAPRAHVASESSPAASYARVTHSGMYLVRGTRHLRPQRGHTASPWM